MPGKVQVCLEGIPKPSFVNRMARANPASILFPVLMLKASSVSTNVFLVQFAYLIRAPAIAAGPNRCKRFRSVEMRACVLRLC